MNKIIFCAISNVSSGSCPEDCAYCAQSAKYKADIEKYKQKEVGTVVEEAKRAKANGALGFCIVTAGERLDDKKTEYIASLAKAVKAEVEGLFIIACNGIAGLENLKALKAAGVDSYNHNLETSKEYFPKICTTHTWDERFQTNLNAKAAGLMVCSGGIFGMGESEADRESFLASLAELSPMSIPLNFYHPNPALPIKTNNLKNIDEGLALISRTRELFPNSMVMVAGGRESFFGERQKEIFANGCNSVVVGDYLTAKGQEANLDKSLVEEAGLVVETECPFGH